MATLTFTPSPCTQGEAPGGQQRQRHNSGNVTWLLPDQNGSVQDVVNEAGTSVDHVVFDAFGNKLVPDTGTASLYGYQGMVQDPAMEIAGTTSFLYYDNARWFSTQTGDFLSQDPSGYSAGDNTLADPDDPLTQLISH
ncbi:MAG: hypothetical protein ABSH22_20375 [Tepidisphaeraceae bacterium]